jgi:hypothetical protein
MLNSLDLSPVREYSGGTLKARRSLRGESQVPREDISNSEGTLKRGESHVPRCALLLWLVAASGLLCAIKEKHEQQQ